MIKNPDQLKNRINFIIGCLLIPGIFITGMCSCDITRYNITGLLAEDRFFPYIHIICFAYLLYLYFQFHNQNRRILYLFELLAVTAVCIPYNESSSLMSSLHLLFSYASFLVFQILLFRRIWMKQKVLSFYIAVCILCAMIILTASSINGIAELIYACAVSIMTAFI